MTALAASPVRTFGHPHAAETVEPEDLLKTADNGLYELVDGELVEKQSSVLSGRVAKNIVLRLGGFVEDRKLGELMIEVSFKCFPDKPSQTRRPDLAFVSAARLGTLPNERHVPFRPDLAVEVMSPNDNAVELETKLMDYRSAGIPLVWVINPTGRSARVYRPDGSSQLLLESGALAGEDVVPGFRATLGELLPVPSAATV